MASKVAPATHRAAIEVSSTEKRAGARSKHLPEFLYLSLSNRAPCLVEAGAQARRFDKQNAGLLRILREEQEQRLSPLRYLLQRVWLRLFHFVHTRSTARPSSSRAVLKTSSLLWKYM